MSDIQSISLDEISTMLRQKYSRNTDDVLDSVYRNQAAGSIESAASSAIYGFNTYGTPGAVPINKDYHGYIFFTRPDLNLSSANLRSSRYFNPLMNKDPKSIHRALRCIMDPNLGFRNSGVSSELVNNRQAFIPLLSNACISFGGVPDLAAQTYTSPQGLYHEAMAWVDGTVLNNATYDISLTFKNMPGSPIIQMIYYWMLYSSYVYLGELMPYPENVANNRIDYNTRIYRIITDETKRYVRNIWACGAAFPVSCPIGALFNFESDRPLNNSLEQFSLSFQCIGSQTFDDILIDEFNRVQWQYFNPSFSPDRRSSSYQKLAFNEYELFNYTAFPYINPTTMELEWWVDKTEYANLKGRILSKF